MGSFPVDGFEPLVREGGGETSGTPPMKPKVTFKSPKRSPSHRRSRRLGFFLQAPAMGGGCIPNHLGMGHLPKGPWLRAFGSNASLLRWTMAKAAKEKKKEVQKGWASDAEVQRVSGSLEELALGFPPSVRNHLKSAAPYLAIAWIHFLIALPHLVKAAKKVQAAVMMLPDKIFWAILSFLVCFFGGIFPVTIAAAEAWNLCGGIECWEQTKVLLNEFMKVADASKEEAKEEDKDKDQKETLSSNDIIQKKMAVALRVMEPEKVSTSLSTIYVAWIGVIGVLRLQFARTVTLGEVIGSKVYKPISKIEPAIESVIPEDYQKWVPVVTRWTCKAIAISLAWWIQRIISAVHSAIRGGMIFAEYLVDFLHEKGYLEVEHKDTYIDEAIGWSIAALGFLTQLACGFQLPWFLNFFLWPIQLLEATIVWTVSA
ncbi:unnamed protein product [Effrenium voratum]|nr:unnamed protein product [Effrenium voratum]